MFMTLALFVILLVVAALCGGVYWLKQRKKQAVIDKAASLGFTQSVLLPTTQAPYVVVDQCAGRLLFFWTSMSCRVISLDELSGVSVGSAGSLTFVFNRKQRDSVTIRFNGAAQRDRWLYFFIDKMGEKNAGMSRR